MFRDRISGFDVVRLGENKEIVNGTENRDVFNFVGVEFLFECTENNLVTVFKGLVVFFV